MVFDLWDHDEVYGGFQCDMVPYFIFGIVGDLIIDLVKDFVYVWAHDLFFDIFHKVSFI